MDFNFSSYSGANFHNFMGENSLVRIEEDDIEVLKENFTQNNPTPADPFDEKLFEICNKNLVLLNEIQNKEREKIENNYASLGKEEFLFRIKFNQNFLISSHLREIDLSSNTNNYTLNDKREFKFQQQKGFQFKNLKRLYIKTKEENKNMNDSESQEIINTKKSGIFDNYNTNDHDKFFDLNVKNPKYKNSIKQPTSILNPRKSNPIPGFRSSLSILTKKNDLCKGEPHFDLKSIMEHQVLF